MFPLYPLWTRTNGSPSKYPSSNLYIPKINSKLAYGLSLGPEKLNDSKGKVNKAFWLATYKEDGFIYISKAAGGQWSSPLKILNPLVEVKSLSLTFDQLGDPIIFFQDYDDFLKVWFFDGAEGEKVIKNIGKGNQPLATFDYSGSTSNENSDAFIFYVRDNKLYSRIQREKFAVESFTGVEEENLRLKDCGKNAIQKMQVRYLLELSLKGVEYPINLIIKNPEAEQGVDFWDQLEGNLIVRQENPPPQKGSNYWLSNSATMKYEQKFSAESEGLSSEIINGASELVITWWQASYSGSDKAGMGARFYDDQGVLIREHFSDIKTITPPKEWQQQNTIAEIPEGTKSFSITLLGERIAGSNSDGYLDNVSAVLNGNGGGYTPPPIEPPVPPQINGRYVYTLSYATQLKVPNTLIDSPKNSDIKIEFNLYGATGSKEKSGNQLGAFGFPVYCEGAATIIHPANREYNRSVFTGNGVQLRWEKLKAARNFSLSFMYGDNQQLSLYLVINGKANTFTMPFDLEDGYWYVEINGLNVIVGNDTGILFTGEIKRGEDVESVKPGGFFAAYNLQADGFNWRANFTGAYYDIAVTVDGNKTSYALTDYMNELQPSTPAGNDLTISNHRPANWQYVIA